jgi:GNAT superfamily N-acetyltransferase
VAIDHEPDADHDERWAAFREEVGEGIWQRVAAYDDAVGAEKPARPHWYLGVLATLPAAQGRGLATAVLQPALAAAAADGWDCWLETSSPVNKAFYAGRGFTEGRAVDLPGGPPTWWLGHRHAERAPG